MKEMTKQKPEHKNKIHAWHYWHFDTFASKKREEEHMSHDESGSQMQKTQVTLLTL